MIVAVDASIWQGEGFAAIAVCEMPSGKLLGGEVLETNSANVAEGCAAIRACQSLSARSQRGSWIWTDSLQLVLAVEGKRRGDLGGLTDELSAMLAVNELNLQHRMRRDVKIAHNAARQLNKAFQAGRRGEATWRQPTYVREVLTGQ